MSVLLIFSLSLAILVLNFRLTRREASVTTLKFNNITLRARRIPSLKPKSPPKRRTLIWFSENGLYLIIQRYEIQILLSRCSNRLFINNLSTQNFHSLSFNNETPIGRLNHKLMKKKETRKFRISFKNIPLKISNAAVLLSAPFHPKLQTLRIILHVVNLRLII